MNKQQKLQAAENQKDSRLLFYVGVTLFLVPVIIISFGDVITNLLCKKDSFGGCGWSGFQWFIGLVIIAILAGLAAVACMIASFSYYNKSQKILKK